jgi:hypothetical protein
MIITNLTSADYWFGPMHLPAGSGQTINLDDTSDTSLYLLNDEVADAVNTLFLGSSIAVTSYAMPFPRPTGTPSLLHGDGSPQGKVYAPQGSLYMRRDSTQASTGLYTKTTGVTVNTGWIGVIAPSTTNWVTIPSSSMSNGFVYPTSSGTPVRYMITSDGTVWLQGAVWGGTAGTVAFNLPTGFRPSQNIVVPTQIWGSSGDTWVTVNSNGDVVPGNSASCFNFAFPVA